MSTQVENRNVVQSNTKDINEEDNKIKEELQMLVDRLKDNQKELYLPALEAIRELIQSSTTSITSVPKPLKYMTPYYQDMKNIYKKLHDKETKERCADIISVLAMTMGQDRDCISYRLLANSSECVCSWGHEYVRHLSSEIATSWPGASQAYKDTLLVLVRQIIPYTIAHNAEAEACDLLMEIDQLDLLNDYIEEGLYPKISLYLLNCVPFVPAPENTAVLRYVLALAKRFDRHVEAVRIAFMLNDSEEVTRIYENCPMSPVKKQIAFMIARQRGNIGVGDSANQTDVITNNGHLNHFFLSLARDLDIVEAKSPENIYKNNLESDRFTHQADSARNNLAASIVNGFLNVGFGTDELLRDYSKWIFKNKEHGMISAVASIGLIKLWDVDGGLTDIDKYLYSSEDYIKAGALLGCGILNCGIKSDVEPAHAILSEYFTHGNQFMRSCAVLGIGIAYAGTNSAIALESLGKILNDVGSNIEMQGLTCLSIGLIAVGTCNSVHSNIVFQQALQCSESKTQNPYTRFVFLALGFLYLSCQSSCEVMIEKLSVLKEPFKTYSHIIVEMCAYAGSGNVLKVQRFLHICSEHSDEKSIDDFLNKKNTTYDKFDFTEIQIVAVIGVALIAMGEEIGTEMVLRSFGHLMQYGESCIRRTVPLAIAICYTSNAKQRILHMLNKFSHDNDTAVCQSAIFAMGLVGAGTNNARLALLLRQLAQFYYKDASTLFIVRIAQGLTHLGKGTMTLSPYHLHGRVLKLTALSSILSTIFAVLNIKTLILGSAHYLLYLLTPAIEPRCLITFDENLEQLQIPVRVGIAVDVVAQAGKPKTITGFQTNNTPVLLSAGERAELATDEYEALTPFLEGFVILEKKTIPDHII